jgi:DNA ligase (NAD+)
MKKYKFKTDKEYIEILSKANEAYYNTGETIMTDKEYDDLRDEFQSRFPDHEFLKQVGAEVEQSTFAKVKHEIPMGSQAKVNHPSELKDWAKKQSEKVQGEFSYLVSEKVDGFSLELKYEKGKFTQAITRGDGLIGDDVTVNVKKMKQVPLELKNKITATFRGESVLFINDFNEFFPDKANPRNAAAGTVRRLDGDRCEHLTFLCYDILTEDKKLSSELDKFKTIESLGFTTPLYVFCDSLDKVIELWSEYENGKREQSLYEMDGLIVAINSLDHQKVLGIIDQRPRFSRAFKFSAQMGQTTINEVQWFVGRTGRITPVAVVSPIKLSGVTISNITLHNLSEINRLGANIGAEVLIKRAGDVIPKIEQVIKKGKEEIKTPSHCPSCNSKTVAEEIFLWCKNSLCPAQNYGNLLHWVKSLEIKGFGDELVQQLFDSQMIKEPADFYTLTVEQIASLDRRGEKSATKVLEALHNKKDLTVPELIKGLGFSSISDKIAEVIQVQYPTLEDMMEATPEGLASIHGIGEIVAQNFSKGLKERKKLIKNLLKHISLKKSEVVKGGPLEGQSFCFTGVRDKNLEKNITSLGGKIASGVSKNLTVLVAKDPEENSSKLNKARELKVQILTLTQAQALVEKVRG